MFQKEHLVKLANVRMPFGKYSGRAIIDLPEEYLLWFQKKGFPEGELGTLMALALEFKIEGLESVIRPLKRPES
ncbi:hypothetical protein C942_02708 [Photobacterium marinum]|uniref:Cytoplasmic protein n=1 Tax=Photobacterium marinum TaxID=1056511 RepID=L8JED5_9GAMM|nr:MULTISPECIES: DUF3820 family protein [Photobacterium]ELR67200.1 hypothetical protein C942_02708 [Photobacterium marinum]